ncbi:MAG: hypothetical protein IJT44_05515 [Clostridia bacterium]|nr:hypothetical protein [Clostridia bacterium]
MRRKIWILLGVIAVMAVALSVTVFAQEDPAAAEIELTNYNLIDVLYRSITMTLDTVFAFVDKIYVLFKGLF